MSKETSVILLGILVVLVPQLGIPSPWRTILLTLLGLAIGAIGVYLRTESMSRRTNDNQPFVEHIPQTQPPPMSATPAQAHDESETASG